MKTCTYQDGDERCENLVEGRTEYCASHNALIRKAQKEALKPKKKPKAIKKFSAKRVKEVADYSILAKQYLSEHEACEARIENVCDGQSIQVHHKAKRGVNLLNYETFMAVCYPCHHHIETVMSADERREKGFLLTVNNQTV